MFLRLVSSSVVRRRFPFRAPRQPSSIQRAGLFPPLRPSIQQVGLFHGKRPYSSKSYRNLKRWLPAIAVAPPAKVLLPPPVPALADRATLVLDLDECLVKSREFSFSEPWPTDLQFPVLYGGDEQIINSRLRPSLNLFLRTVAPRFEVIVFTSAVSEYADVLLNLLDPTGDLIHGRLFRDACRELKGVYFKDLTVLGRDLSRVALIDNSPEVFAFQWDNGIPIEEFWGDKDSESDNELMKLVPFLDELATAEDVRPLIRDRYRLRELVTGADLEEE